MLLIPAPGQTRAPTLSTHAHLKPGDQRDHLGDSGPDAFKYRGRIMDLAALGLWILLLIPAACRTNFFPLVLIFLFHILIEVFLSSPASVMIQDTLDFVVLIIYRKNSRSINTVIIYQLFVPYGLTF